MKCWLALLAWLLGFSLGLPASAMDGAGPHVDRSGFYLRAGGGLGYSLGSYEFTGMSAPGFVPVRELHWDVDLRGAALAAHAAAGWGIVPGVALALEGGAFVMPAFGRHGPLGETTIDGALLVHAGPLVDVYPWLDSPVHAQVGVALARAMFVSSTNDIGSAENIVDVVPLTGFLIQGGIGYELVGSVDLALRASYASLSGADSGYAATIAAVEVAYVHF
jgi:hypothetical protein